MRRSGQRYDIYIDVPDVKAEIDNVLEERGIDWLKAVMDYHLSQGYGKINNLHNYEGYIKCLEERKVREMRILSSINTEHYIISRDTEVSDLISLFMASE